MSEKTVNITLSDLKDLMAELRKPVKSEEQIQAEEAAKQNRAELGAVMQQVEANKKARQKACRHMRPNGSTTTVYIQNGNYLICQHQQCIIRPEEDPETFDKHYQLAMQAGE